MHKWTGIALAAVLALTSVTGFMLLIKKKVAWIQPPTVAGAPGEPADFISVGRLFDILVAQGHPDFRTANDVDRIDMRPDKRVFRVHSQHNYSEIQVCAVTGGILNVATRRSDFLENLHDGSFFGEWIHAWFMPLVAVALMFMVLSGLWLWIEPMLRKRRRKRGLSRR